jgi:hypothetical protein
VFDFDYVARLHAFERDENLRHKQDKVAELVAIGSQHDDGK